MKTTITLTLLLISLITKSQGINFHEGFTWNELKQKAEKENKYIFIDVFATWCVPCKVMDQTVYTNQKIGDFFNQRFISVKLQMDRTKKDNEEAKKWYKTADELEKKYHIKAYPTLLFLSPQGELVSKLEGSKSVDQMIISAKDALDPDKQYSRLLAHYESGKREPGFVRALARAVKNNGNVVKARKIANDYLAALNESQLREEENVQFAGDFLETSKDRGFMLFLNEWPQMSKYIANKDFGPTVTSLIIFNEEIKPFLETKNGKPDYTLITSNLSKYGQKGSDVYKNVKVWLFNKHELTPLLLTYPSWENIKSKIDLEKFAQQEAEAFRLVLSFYNNGIIGGNSGANLCSLISFMDERFPDKLSLEDKNGAAYQVAMASQIIEELQQALKWSKTVIDKDSNPGFLDTYAKLLYRLKRKPEAIDWMNRAIKAMGNKNPDFTRDLKETLSSMESGKPIGWIYGEPVKGKDKIDFSGTWKLDSLTGDFSGMAAQIAAPVEMSIRQDENKFNLLAKFGTNLLPAEELDLNGNASFSQISGTKIIRRMIWSEDRSILTMYSTYQVTPEKGDPWEYTRQQSFMLLDGGKSMLLSRITVLPNKVDNVKAVYRRQN